MIKTIILIFTFLIINIPAQNQISKTDSLNSLIDNSSHKKQLHYIKEMASLFTNYNETEKAIHDLKITLAVATKTNNKKNIALTNLRLGAIYSSFKKYNKAKEYFLQSIDLFNELENWPFLEISMELHYLIYGEEQNFKTAVQLAKQAQKISEKDPENIHGNNSNIGYFFQRLNQLDSAEYYFQKALSNRLKYKKHKRVLDSYSNLIYVYEITGQYQKCMDIVHQQELYCKTNLDNYQLAEVITSKANWLRFLGDPKALDVYFEALNLSEKSGNNYSLGRSYEGLGDFYALRNNYSNALENYVLAVNIFKQNRLTRDEAFVEVGICKIHRKLRQFKKALVHINRALSLNNEIGYEQQRAQILAEKSFVLYLLKNYNEALNYVNESINIYKSHNQFHELTKSLLNKSNILTKQKKFLQAEKIIQTAQKNNETLKQNTIKLEIAHSIYLLNETKGNYKQAITFLKEKKHIQNNLANKNLEKYAKKLKVIYETNKKDQENEILRREKEAQQSVISTQHTAGVLITITLILVILLSIFLFKERTKLKEAKKLLENQNQQILRQTGEINQQATELKESNKHLIELDKFKEVMLGMIIHDLKNPLNFIVGKTKNSDKEDMDSLMIHQAGIRMYTLVNNILDIQKFNEVGISLNLNEESLYEIVSDTIDQVNFMAEYKNLKIENKVPTNFHLKLDKELISRVFINILNNAIKFTDDGKITIEADQQDDNMVKSSITDTGWGISEKDQKLIFQKFGQVKTLGDNEYHSTGLGLNFCKLAIEAHGGKIGVISEKDKGSTFWFTLPKEKGS